MAEMIPYVGPALSVMGALGEGQAAMAQGEGANRLAKYQARQLRTNAGQAEAAGQRDAELAQRESMLLQSRALAVAAASGGGALDPTVLNLIGGIAGEGQLAADTERYNAAVDAQGMRTQAAATEYEGKLALANAKRSRTASFIKAGTVLAGTTGFKGAAQGNTGGVSKSSGLRTTAPSSGGLKVGY